MILNEILNEMTQGEVSYMQRELNAIYKPIGIKFVITKHVMDRVNNTDGREKTLSPEEIISTFKKIYNQHGSKFENFYKSGKLNETIKFVIHDRDSNLNIPVAYEIDKITHSPVLVLLTVMKKEISKFGSKGYGVFEITV